MSYLLVGEQFYNRRDHAPKRRRSGCVRVHICVCEKKCFFPFYRWSKSDEGGGRGFPKAWSLLKNPCSMRVRCCRALFVPPPPKWRVFVSI